MISYMEVLPLRCPKCEKSIKSMTNRIIKTKRYHECPKCKYKTKNIEKFIDRKTIEKQKQHFQKMLDKCRE